MNPYWPENVAIWRKLLCGLLILPAFLALLGFVFFYRLNWGLYQLAVLVDGRPNLATFDEWLKS